MTAVLSNKRGLSMHIGSLYFIKGKIASDRGQASQAESFLQTVKTVYEDHLTTGGDFASIRLATVYKEIANLRASKDMFAEALQMYKNAYTLFKKIFPNEMYRGISATYNDIANTCITFKKYDLAQEYLEAAVKLNRNMFGDDSLEIGTNYHTLGNMHSKKME